MTMRRSTSSRSSSSGPGRRRTRRRDTVPARTAAIRGLATLAVVGAISALSVTLYSGVPGKSYRTVYAEIPQAGNLTAKDPVRISGVRVGQLQGSTTTKDGLARLELQLDGDTVVPRDSKIQVRANGLLGARYIQIVPGTSSARLADGGTVRGGDDSLTNGVSETLDVLDAPARKGLGSTIDGLGAGMLGNGERLNAALRSLRGGVAGAPRLADAILRRPGAIERFVPATQSLVGPLDDTGERLPALFSALEGGLESMTAERGSFQRTLDVAPRALRAATAGSDEGTRLLASLGTLSNALNVTLPGASEGLRQTTRLLERRAPLRSATAVLRTAVDAVPEANRMLDAVKPLLTPARELFADLSPMVTYAGKYGCDIENFGVTFRSMTGFAQSGEHGPVGPPGDFRLVAVVDPSQSVGLKDQAMVRDSYGTPCQRLGTTYDSLGPGGSK